MSQSYLKPAAWIPFVCREPSIFSADADGIWNSYARHCHEKHGSWSESSSNLPSAIDRISLFNQVEWVVCATATINNEQTTPAASTTRWCMVNRIALGRLDNGVWSGRSARRRSFGVYYGDRCVRPWAEQTGKIRGAFSISWKQQKKQVEIWGKGGIRNLTRVKKYFDHVRNWNSVRSGQ